MTLVCGTDFSASSEAALASAVLLAQRANEDVLLVYVSAFLGWQASVAADASGPAPSSGLEAALAEVKRDFERRLALEARSFEGRGVTIRTELLQGPPDERLVAIAERAQARLIVIGALGHRSASSWTLGGTADRVAQRARSPVLVVRRAETIERWIAKREPLRVLVGVDDSESSERAVAGLRQFVGSMPCEITGVHVYWPPEQSAKLGMHGSMPLDVSAAPIERALRSALEPRLALGAPPIELKCIGGLGRASDHLVQASIDLASDLVVVGNNQRKGLDKVWHGSVSHGVIARAPANVLCVPLVAR
jgi:nucleotide-binding universal stress UspA family protein